MKTYSIFTDSSKTFPAAHSFKAASFNVQDGVYIFYDERAEPIHAIAVAPNLFVRTDDVK